MCYRERERAKPLREDSGGRARTLMAFDIYSFCAIEARGVISKGRCYTTRKKKRHREKERAAMRAARAFTLPAVNKIMAILRESIRKLKARERESGRWVD